MAKIKRFEDIEAWKKARRLVADIYSLTEDGSFTRDFGLRDQIRRASISIMLNIAEGFARRTDRQFSHFLSLAHGSVAEVQSALYVALDQEYVDKEAFDRLFQECDEISRMISGLIKYLRGSRGPRLSDR